MGNDSCNFSDGTGTSWRSAWVWASITARQLAVTSSNTVQMQIIVGKIMEPFLWGASGGTVKETNGRGGWGGG